MTCKGILSGIGSFMVAAALVALFPGRAGAHCDTLAGRSVADGRAYVHAYVAFVHYAERLFVDATAGDAALHEHE